MTSSVLILAVTLFIAGGASAAKVPPNWKVCKRTAPPKEYDSCIKLAVQGAIDDLAAKGEPTLGIPPINPLKITTLDIGKGSGPVAIDLRFTDVETRGLDAVEITKIRHKDAENFKFGADAVAKKPVRIKAKYTLNGKVLVLPVKGQGDCNLVLDNMKVSLNLEGRGFKKGEVTYMNVTKCDFSFDTDRLHLNFENLFDGNKQLGDNMNQFVNENWSAILKELQPSISEGLSAALASISNQIFHNIPYNKFLPRN